MFTLIAVLFAAGHVAAADSGVASIPPGEAGAKAALETSQDGRDGANLAAALKAWPATVQFLRKHLE